jgi:hypothetical protein
VNGKPANDTNHTKGKDDMKIELKDPTTGKQAVLEVPEWKMLLGMVAAASDFRSLASVHVLAAMLANPEYMPPKENGEETPAAYARRACDYADALLAELQRRTAKAAAETDKHPSAFSRAAATPQSV